MEKSNWKAILDAVSQPALDYFDSLPERRVYRPSDPEEVRSLLGGPLPEDPSPAEDVVAAIARDLEPFVTSHASGRYFGFVIGGLHPAAYGAELLTATWDQNTGLYAVTPGVAIVEEIAHQWLLELL